MFDPRELDEVAGSLPVGPTILSRLHAMLNSERSSTIDIVLAVRMDPALAAAVIHVARSALYGSPHPPETIDDAVVRVGFKEVARIVSYTVLHQLAEPLPLYGESADFFWRKSLACAFAMELLAARAQQPTEPAYLIGLLHAIGAILLQRTVQLRGPAEAVVDPLAPEGPAAQELRLLGIHQGSAASHALRAWGFPDTLVAPIEHQFDPELAGPHAAAAYALGVAKYLSLQTLGRPDLARLFTRPPVEIEPALAFEMKERLLALDEVSSAIARP